MSSQPLDAIPLWAVYPVTVILLLAALAAGFWLVIRGQREPPRSDAGVGSISGAVLAIFAFLGAFVVGFAVNIAQERRTLLVSEANAISTTYLQAGYMEEPFRSNARSLLREYVDQRINGSDPQKLDAAIARSEEIHQELWGMVEEIVRSGNSAPTTALFITSLGQVIDLHTLRVVMGVQVRVPPAAVLALYAIALLSVFLVGRQMGYTDRRDSTALVIEVLVVALVLFVIVDLDRVSEGLLRTPKQVLVDLRAILVTLP